MDNAYTIAVFADTKFGKYIEVITTTNPKLVPEKIRLRKWSTGMTRFTDMVGMDNVRIAVIDYALPLGHRVKKDWLALFQSMGYRVKNQKYNTNIMLHKVLTAEELETIGLPIKTMEPLSYMDAMTNHTRFRLGLQQLAVNPPEKEELR